MSLINPTFMEKYNVLPFLEKKILQILSISYARVTQTQLLACLVALDIKTDDGKHFDAGTKNAILKRLRNELHALLEGDFLQGKNRSVLVVNRVYVEISFLPGGAHQGLEIPYCIS